jgi:hypothetical protein
LNLSNYKDLTFDKAYNAICGFTEDEILSYFNKDLENKLSILKQTKREYKFFSIKDLNKKIMGLYGGYCWGKDEAVANTARALNFLSGRSETGRPELAPNSLLWGEIFRRPWEALFPEALEARGRVLANPADAPAAAALFYSGYLALDFRKPIACPSEDGCGDSGLHGIGAGSEPGAPEDEAKEGTEAWLDAPKLKIPNEEIKRRYYDDLLQIMSMKRLKQINLKDSEAILMHLISKNEKKIIKIFTAKLGFRDALSHLAHYKDCIESIKFDKYLISYLYILFAAAKFSVELLACNNEKIIAIRLTNHQFILVTIKYVAKEHRLSPAKDNRLFEEKLAEGIANLDEIKKSDPEKYRTSIRLALAVDSEGDMAAEFG